MDHGREQMIHHVVMVVLSLVIILGAFGIIMFDGGDPNHPDHNPPRNGV
jgi:hypothetical protein